MAEPDVIDRMAKAYVTAKGEVVGKRMMSPPPEQRMLAAVRELVNAAAHHPEISDSEFSEFEMAMTRIIPAHTFPGLQRLADGRS